MGAMDTAHGEQSCATDTTVTMLHAITIAWTLHVSRNSLVAVAHSVMKSAFLSPYGALAKWRPIAGQYEIANAKNLCGDWSSLWIKRVTSKRHTMPVSVSSKQFAAALRAYVRGVQGRFGAQLGDVLLFGSQAHNERTVDSDAYVMVILNQPTKQNLSEARGLASDRWVSHRALLSIRAFSARGWQELEAIDSLFYYNITSYGVSLLPTAT